MWPLRTLTGRAAVASLQTLDRGQKRVFYSRQGEIVLALRRRGSREEGAKDEDRCREEEVGRE